MTAEDEARRPPDQVPRSHPRPDLVGILGTLLASAALHFVVARVLLAGLGAARSTPGARETVDLAVAATAMATLALLWLRARGPAPGLMARELPRVQVLVSALATLVIAPTVSPHGIDILGAPPELLPPFAAAFSGGVLVALVSSGLVRSLIAKSGLAVDDAPMPPTLAGAYARLLGGLGVVVLLVTAAALVDRRAELALGIHGAVAIGAAAALLLAAVLAGVAAGRSLASDAESLARRLDALGHAGTLAEQSPIVATERDQAGELLGELERLRARLHHEQLLYQQALDRTQAADAQKVEFLSAVSHELRTPLHTVGGYAQLLLEGVPAPLADAQAEDVRLIQAGGRQLLGLLNDILDVSMIESGELTLSFAPADIGELVAETVRIHQPLVRDRDVELRAQLPSASEGGELPPVVCDRRRIAQILTNLVGNAIKFTEHGSIVLRAESIDGGRGVAVHCIDTGVGIAPGEIDFIFEEYRQAGTISRRKKGTGLGLAIARSIAQAHGGKLTVSSFLGEGSTFTLGLPCDPPRKPTTIDIAEEVARARVRQRGDTLGGFE
jgi:signal transduction histidine kinase